GLRAPEYAAAKVDARDFVAVGPVTVRARIPENPSAIVDIGRGVVLRPGESLGTARQERADENKDTDLCVNVRSAHSGNPRMSAHLTPFRANAVFTTAAAGLAGHRRVSETALSFHA